MKPDPWEHHGGLADKLREPPANLEAEQELLGAVLLTNSVIPKVRTIVGPNDFADPRHQAIFKACLALVDQGQVANPVTLKPYFESAKTLDEIGGTRYLAALASAATTILNVTDYAELVRDLSVRRSTIAIAEEAMARAYDFDPNKSGVAVASESAKRLEALAAGGSSRGVINGRDLALEVLADLDKEVLATPTGIKELDDALIGGLHPGRCYGFAARSKKGKTVLLSTISLNMAAENRRHMFIAAEMGSKSIMQRQLAYRTGYSSATFIRPPAARPPSFKDHVALSAAAWPQAQQFVDEPGIHMRRLRELVARAILIDKCEGVIVDYLQLIAGKPWRMSGADWWDEVAYWFAAASKRLGCWFAVAMQTNQEGNIRGGEGARLAFDAVFDLVRNHEADAPVKYDAALRMMATRYTEWQDVGEADENGNVIRPGIIMNPRGPHFENPPSPPPDAPPGGDL